MKVLLLGGTGNISSDYATLLVAKGHSVSVLTRGRNQIAPGLEPLRADRKDRNEVKLALGRREFDCVVNFIGYSPEDLALDYELFQNRTAQYLFISSATVYAKPPPSLPITESSPLSNPWWDYAQKKIACETWLMERWQQNSFPVTIVRPSHTYSKRWVPNLVSSSSYTVPSRMEQGKPVFVTDDGETPWTLTAAEDFAQGLLGLTGLREAIGEAFHITSDEVLTWNSIYATIARALGVHAPEVLKIPTGFICSVAPHLTGTLKGDKTHPGIFDNSKLKRFVPGFTCRVPFESGVAKSIEWLRGHPEEQNLSETANQTIETIVAHWRALHT